MRILVIKLVIAGLVFVLTGGFCCAAEDYTDIRLKVGESKIRISQDILNIEKPYISKGATMVPLRVITEAFGEEVNWNRHENSVRIINLNSNIKLVIGKGAAIVDGVEKSLLCAPKIVNETTMVPLRFISENFGAVVHYDDKTKEIYIRIPYRDFESRFKYITQGQIGDIYFGWSVSFPKGCSIVDKKTSGISTLVRNGQEGYYYYIYTVKAEDINSESDLLEELLDYVDGERVVSQQIIENNRQRWAVVVLESEDEVYEYRAAIKDNRIYQIHFYTHNKGEFLDEKKGKKYRDIIDSFSLSYKGDESGIRDVNEIEDGFYTYRDKNYGWSIDLIPTMNRDFKKSINYYEITDERGKDEGITCGAEFFSSNPQENLDSYIHKKLNEIYEDINNEYLNEPVIQDIKVGGIPAKKVKYEINIGNKNYTFYDLYLISGNYIYNVYLVAKSEIFNANLKVCDKILSSFTPIKSKMIGKIANPYEQLRGKTYKYSNSLYEWSCMYPAWWNLKEDKDSKTVAITDRSGLLEVYVGVAQNVSVDSVRERLLEKISTFKNSKDFKVISDQTILEKGIQMSKYVCEYKLEEAKYYYKAYVFNVGEKVFGVHFTIADVVNSESTARALNELWDSMQFDNFKAISQ